MMITSTQNPRIKRLLALDKKKERQTEGVFPIEGIKEIEQALAGGIEITEIYHCPDIPLPPSVQQKLPTNVPITLVSPAVYQKIAYRESTGGIVAVAQTPAPRTLQQIPTTTSNLLVLVIDGVEKPGNLGALLRTADAAQLHAVIVCDPTADLYNPNTIRASLGCLFTVPVICTSTQQAIEWLLQHNVTIFATELQASSPYYQHNYKQHTAIVVGTEATGITPAWRTHAHHNIIIPMHGTIDSMNVSVSAAIVLFEALRQRTLS